MHMASLEGPRVTWGVGGGWLPAAGWDLHSPEQGGGLGRQGDFSQNQTHSAYRPRWVPLPSG